MVWIMTHSPIMDTSSQVRSLDRWMVIILSFHEKFHPLFFPVIFLVLSKSISYWSNSAWFQRTCHGPKINIFVMNSNKILCRGLIISVKSFITLLVQRLKDCSGNPKQFKKKILHIFSMSFNCSYCISESWFLFRLFV